MSNTAWHPRIAPPEAEVCPWCDGTGQYARDAANFSDRGITWVPCGYCKATGVKA